MRQRVVVMLMVLLSGRPQVVVAKSALTEVWGSTGVAVCSASGAQTAPSASRDGRVGTFVVWTDARTDAGDIYGAYLNADGTLRAGWDSDGTPICTATGFQGNPVVVADGQGGAIVAWVDARSGDADLYAQRLTRDGALLWATNGVAVCTVAGTQQRVAMVDPAPGS
jgi:hypothetical protein